MRLAALGSTAPQHRSLPQLSYYRRPVPTAPSRQATEGALSIFVQGHREENPRLMLFGLSVLRDATAGQVGAAIAALEFKRLAVGGEIAAMLAV